MNVEKKNIMHSSSRQCCSRWKDNPVKVFIQMEQPRGVVYSLRHFARSFVPTQTPVSFRPCLNTYLDVRLSDPDVMHNTYVHTSKILHGKKKQTR